MRLNQLFPLKQLFLGLIVFFPMISTAKTQETTPRIVVSFSILQDVVKNLVPAEIKVISLIPPGLDPHSYQVRPEDFLHLKKAQVVIAVGEGFDSWIREARLKSQSKASFIECSSQVNLLESDHHHKASAHDHHTQKDPHFWHSPQMMQELIEKLQIEFTRLFPNHRDEIERKTKDYVTKIQSLENRFQAEFQKLKSSERKMVIPHNSFQYFSRDFKVEILSPMDMNQKGEATVQQVASLMKRIKSEKIKALFFEQSAPQNLIKILAQEAQLDIQGTLFSDTLSTSSEASTYLGMLEHNLSLVLKTMKGSKP